MCVCVLVDVRQLEIRAYDQTIERSWMDKNREIKWSLSSCPSRIIHSCMCQSGNEESLEGNIGGRAFYPGARTSNKNLPPQFLLRNSGEDLSRAVVSTNGRFLHVRDYRGFCMDVENV